MRSRIGIMCLVAGILFAQKMTVKDSDTNVLMEVNDEGTVGSITLEDSTAAPSVATNKLYNVDGSLYWNGAALGLSGSAGGWTDEGENVYTTAWNDKVGIGTSTPEFRLSLDYDGGIIAKGAHGSGNTLTTTGSGTRLIWYPKNAAFRAGDANGSEWDNANIGFCSAAMGLGTTASGEYSMATGFSTSATGHNSTALGYMTTANNYWSTAMGYQTTASGNISTAMGSYTTASGSYSTAMGNYTNANSLASMAIGQYNLGGGTADSWVTTDPIFEIGIGADDLNKANALTVLKNGNVGIGATTPEFKLSIEDDGGIIAKGTYNHGATLSTSGLGTRLIWYPRKAAFRAGYADNNQWNDFNIGDKSTAMGWCTTASGNSSTAMGFSTTASGDCSTATGFGNTASGSYSTAMGGSTTASGSYSTAMGFASSAGSYASVSIGRYNVGGGTTGSWVGSDPQFEIGVGADVAHKANAMTVLKNGNVGIGKSNPGYLLEMEASGGGHYDASTHQWVAGSTRAIKQDIKPNLMNLQKVLDQVEVVNYRYKTQVAENPDAPYHIGFIADDTPELLSGTKHDGMQMTDCIGLLLAVVKEQQKTVEDQQKRIEAMEAEISGMRK
jgi:hypothetical protein